MNNIVFVSPFPTWLYRGNMQLLTVIPGAIAQKTPPLPVLLLQLPLLIRYNDGLRFQ